MSRSKLKNIRAVQKLLQGDHKSQTRKSYSFHDALSNAEQRTKGKREVGEWWIERDFRGKEKAVWEQKEGHRVKHGPGWRPDSEWEKKRQKWRETDREKYRNCFHEECHSRPKNRADQTFSRFYNMCSECAAELETKLKIRGQWEEFVKSAKYANARDWFVDADQQIEEQIENMKKDQYLTMNADGKAIEKMEGKDPGVYLNKVLEEYYEAKEQKLEELKPEKEDFHMEVLKNIKTEFVNESR